LKQNLGVAVGGVAEVEFGGVDGDRVFDFFEQVFVIDDVATGFVVPIEAVDAADGLEETVILHAFVDVEVGAAWRIKSGQEFIDDDQKFHGGGFGFEVFFGLVFVGFGFGFVGAGGDGFEEFCVEVIDVLLVGFGVGSGVFGGDVFGLGVVGGDDRTFAFKGGFLEEFVVFAGFVDAAWRYRDRC
jgi:hypothetical protein